MVKYNRLIWLLYVIPVFLFFTFLDSSKEESMDQREVYFQVEHVEFQPLTEFPQDREWFREPDKNYYLGICKIKNLSNLDVYSPDPRFFLDVADRSTTNSVETYGFRRPEEELDNKYQLACFDDHLQAKESGTYYFYLKADPTVTECSFTYDPHSMYNNEETERIDGVVLPPVS